jgi:hypothetical protein
MKSNRREIRWAVWGFIAGFAFCYVLLALVKPKQPLVPMTSGTAARSVALNWTNEIPANLPFIVEQLPPRMVSEPPGPEVTPTGYYQDLIETGTQALRHDLPDK